MATKVECLDFISQVAPIVQKYAKAYGYHVASPIIAQACIESAYGKSSLGARYHNYFGMKCGSSWKGKSVNLKTKEEYTVGTLTSISANFRVYDSMEEGIKGYFEFISGKRYQNLKSVKYPKEYLQMIKQDGYATSSTYVDTNMNCINKWNLTQYDNLDTEPNKKGSVISAIYPTIKADSLSKAVVVWSAILIKEGFLKAADLNDLFDQVITQATIDYQFKHSLYPDGIVGPKTWTEALKDL